MNNNYHYTRTLLISKKNPNLLVVTVGSNDNIDQASFQKATGRAAIKVFDLTTLPSSGTQFNNSQYGKYMGCVWLYVRSVSVTDIGSIGSATAFETTLVSRRTAPGMSTVSVSCMLWSLVGANSYVENSLDNAYRTTNGQNRDIHINNPAEKVYNCALYPSL